MGNNEKLRLGYIHRFILPSDEMRTRRAQGQKGERNKFTTFLLLHGTGGNEEDLIPLAQQLDQKPTYFITLFPVAPIYVWHMFMSWLVSEQYLIAIYK